jgi:type II secretory ATPase GspE/PulE/Tfp pilus assembly ATPase PilB-like protein
MNNKLATSILRAGKHEGAKEITVEKGKAGAVIRINNGLDQQSYQLASVNADDLKAQFKRLFGLDERDLAIGRRSKVLLGKKLLSAAISAIPDGDSEKIRIELYADKPEQKTLSSIGMDADAQKLAKRILNKKSGLIIVGSPAGEGSSTTAYSLLGYLADRNLSLAAIADFQEIQIDGASHFHKDKRDFTGQLSKIKKSDYDAILIADASPAELEQAIETASHGKLVIVETKDESTKETINRLPLKSSALRNLPEILICNQRLINNNCPHCAKRYSIKKTELSGIFPDIGRQMKADSVPALLSSGCTHCDYRGFTKRLAAFEIARLDSTNGEPAVSIRPIMVDIFRKLLSGTTSAQEAARIARKMI